MFASRVRIGRLFGVEPAGIHAAYQARARQKVAPRIVERGPILDRVEQRDIDLATLPLLKHFETDRSPYITNAVIVSEHPDTGIGNMSYHRSMPHSKTELATSLHSRGDLWRLLQIAIERKQPMPVAMVIGAHPLFIGRRRRAALGAQRADIAGGLLGAPIEVGRTPRYAALPAHADVPKASSTRPRASTKAR